MKINQFDRSVCRTVREAVEKALNDIAPDLGVTFGTSSGSFTNDSFSFKVTSKVGLTTDSDGNAMSHSEREFIENAAKLGLRPDYLGKRFNIRGKVLKITGAKMSRYRYPINVEGPQGGRYKMAAAELQNAVCID